MYGSSTFSNVKISTGFAIAIALNVADLLASYVIFVKIDVNGSTIIVNREHKPRKRIAVKVGKSIAFSQFSLQSS